MMRYYKTYILLSFVCTASTGFSQNFYCDSANGNVVIFSNYDGGKLVINIDKNIPNLKIGIVSYETDSIIFQGAYLSNVTAVEWAGYNAYNNHCPGYSPVSTIIVNSPVSPTINFNPPVGYSNANGYSNIDCNYSCSTTTNQGGCNTADQVAYFFFNEFGSNKLLFHLTQYGCWSGIHSISTGGNCCATPTTTDVAELDAKTYPSPVIINGYLHVESAEQIGRIQVYDLLGNCLYNLEPTTDVLDLDMHSKPSGIYFYRMEIGTLIKVGKVILR